MSMIADQQEMQSPAEPATGPLGDSPLPQSTGRDYHWTMLAISLGVIVLACVLQVRGDQRVQFHWLAGWTLPELCQSKALLGWDCPGCGLTRSFIHLAHGDLAASLQVHRLGWLLALFVLVQIPYRLWALCSTTGSPLGHRLPWIAMWTIVFLLIANWFGGLVERFA